MFDKDALIAALRVRYDFYSAQSMFELACDRAGLADKPALDATELRAFRAALATVGDRIERVLENLDELLASAPAGAAPKRAQDAPSAPVEKHAAEDKHAAEKAEKHAAEDKHAAEKAEKHVAEKAEKHAVEKGAAATAEKSATEKPAAEKHAAEKPAAEKPAAEKPAAEKHSAEKHAAEQAEKHAVEKAAAAAAEKSAAEKPAAEKPAALETTIVLSGLDVAEGEEVLVCGAYGQLGDWDPDRARPMSRKGDQWLATIELAPDTKVAFKFLRRDAAGTLIWESGDDRMLVAAQRLDATWR